MKKAEIMTTVSKTFHKVGFKLKKHSPEILIVAGVVGTVASAVMACKATLKVNEVVSESKETLNAINEAAEAGQNKAGVEYSLEDAKTDARTVYINTAVQVAKLYAPAVALGALSVVGIVSSNNILRKRNAALAAAYATIDKGFKEYRSRVVERFGKEVDYQLKHNIKAQEVEEKVVDENGKEKTVETTVYTADPSVYAKFFDEFSEYHSKNAEANLLFLRGRERYANDLLRIKGRLFLNEVYDMLDIPRTKAGQMVGWKYDPDNPDIDSHVDFGIYDLYDPRKCAFVNGLEHSILLDFNVDGNVWDDM